MRIRRQQLLRVALGVAICGAALTVQAALVFDGLRQRCTIEVLRQDKVPAGLCVGYIGRPSLDVPASWMDK
jgi:hypothetical protein